MRETWRMMTGQPAPTELTIKKGGTQVGKGGKGKKACQKGANAMRKKPK